MADKPPAYQAPRDTHLETDNKYSICEESDQEVLAIATSSRAQGAEASIKSKPIIVVLRLRQVEKIEQFAVTKLRSFTVLKEQKDVLVLNSTTIYENFRETLLLRSRDIGMVPAEIDSKDIWPLTSISTNHRATHYDVVPVDNGNWEAAKQLLLTKEDVLFRLDVAITPKITKNPQEAPQGKNKQKRACAIQ